MCVCCVVTPDASPDELAKLGRDKGVALARETALKRTTEHIPELARDVEKEGADR